jgi:hypothetical protein
MIPRYRFEFPHGAQVEIHTLGPSQRVDAVEHLLRMAKQAGARVTQHRSAVGEVYEVVVPESHVAIFGLGLSELKSVATAFTER